MRSIVGGRRWLLPASLLVLSLACAAGCGDSTGTVAGQVTYKGKAVPGGIITFRSTLPGRSPVSKHLDEDGRFEVTVTASDVQITVDNRELQATGKPLGLGPPEGAKIPGGEAKPAAPSPSAPERLPGKYVEIPAKYYRAETSDLKMTVKSGAQTQNFELK